MSRSLVKQNFKKVISRGVANIYIYHISRIEKE